MRVLRLPLLALLLALPACGDSQTVAENPFFSDRVLNIAHRGGNRQAPEATLEGFRSAKRLGADILEMDVRRSADGHIVVIHDSTVDRTTDGSGRVADKTLEELKALDAGYTWSPDGGVTYPFRGRGLEIPLLSEVLEAFPAEYMVIEIKGSDPTVSVDFAAVLARHDRLDMVVVASFSAEVLEAFREAAPEALTSMAQDEVVTFFALSAASEEGYDPPGQFLQVPPTFSGIEVLTPAFVERAQRFALPIHAWGTDETEESLLRLLDLGVHGFIVDDVALTRRVLDGRTR